MRTRHFCTYFDHNYLPRGMVMLESLYEHYPQAHVYVLCLSDLCYSILTKLAYPHVSLIKLSDLESSDQELFATRVNRTLIEYYFTITPCLPWYLLTGDTNLEEVTYLDADMMFFSSPEPIFTEAGNSSVIITPHRFSKHLSHLIKYGIYNVSWITFKNTSDGLRCLAWYRNSCLEWCKDKLEEDRFADQKYLDFFPKLFSGVHSIRNNGAGLAPWNISGTKINTNNFKIKINNDDLIFYHAHNLKHIFWKLYSTGLYQYCSKIDYNTKYHIIKPYIAAYSKSKYYITKQIKLNINNTRIKPYSKLKKLYYLRDIFHELITKSIYVNW